MVWPILGFKRYLFYLPLSNGVDGVRILHASRDVEPILEKDLRPDDS
jgi:hypothetical protein